MAKGVKLIDDQKEVYIVIDKEKNLVKPLIERLKGSYLDNLYISPDEVGDYINKKTLLIIVDTHIKSFLESIEVYQSCKQVVVIDHHRKMVDHINARIEAPLSREKLKKTKEKLAKNVKRYLDKNGEWKESFEDFSCGEEYWRRVNGHDLLSAIRYVNKSARECFSNEMRYSQNRDFELALSKAYDYECFKNTELYGKMNDVGLIRT